MGSVLEIPPARILNQVRKSTGKQLVDCQLGLSLIPVSPKGELMNGMAKLRIWRGDVPVAIVDFEVKDGDDAETFELLAVRNLVGRIASDGGVD